MAAKLLTRLALVVLIIGVIAYPWAGPSLSTKLSGFDPNFLYVEPQVKGQPTGLVDVKPEKLNITSVGQSQPTVLLAGSEAAFNTSFDILVTHDSEQAAIPFEIVVLFAGTNNRVSLWYYSVEKWIRADVETVNYTQHVLPDNIGHYQPGIPIHLDLSIIPGRAIEFALSNSTWSHKYLVESQELLGRLLNADRRIVEVLAIGGSDTGRVSTSVMLTDFVMTIPNVSLGQKISDSRAIPVFLLVSLSALLILGKEIITFIVEGWRVVMIRLAGILG